MNASTDSRSAWQVNTDLQPLDMDEVKDIVARGDQGKKAKKLWEAYQVAAEVHELQYFQDILDEHERIQQEEQALLLAKEEEKQAKKQKKSKAKEAVDADGDVDMADSDAPPKKKPTNKRKKTSDEDASKVGLYLFAMAANREQKTKIVLKGLKSSGDDAEPAPKKARKSKGPASDEEEKAPQSPVDEEEVRKRKEKTSTSFGTQEVTLTC
jgi:hypothetical protein